MQPRRRRQAVGAPARRTPRRTRRCPRPAPTPARSCSSAPARSWSVPSCCSHDERPSDAPDPTVRADTHPAVVPSASMHRSCRIPPRTVHASPGRSVGGLGELDQVAQCLDEGRDAHLEGCEAFLQFVQATSATCGPGDGADADDAARPRRRFREAAAIAVPSDRHAAPPGPRGAGCATRGRPVWLQPPLSS